MNSTHAALQVLRMKYKAADTAHQHAVRAVTDAIACGETPTQAQLDNEAKTARDVNEARTRYLVALSAG